MSQRIEDTREQILAAGRASLLDFGVRGTSVAQVARRARVGRMTVYRHFTDSGGLLRELMTREFGELFARCAGEARGPHARARLADGLVRAITQMRDHPLFSRIIAAEPELLLPYMFERIGASQRVALDVIADAVREGQSDGSIRAGDVRAIAFSLLLVAQSFAMSAATAQDLPEQRVIGELAQIVDGALRAADGDGRS